MTTSCFRRLPFALVLMVAWPTPGASQRLESLPVGSELALTARRPPAGGISASTLKSIRDSTVYRASHWQEGLVAGGVVGGIVGGLVGAAICGLSESSESSCELKVLLGALVLAPPAAGLGALIGGLFPKEESGPDQGS